MAEPTLFDVLRSALAEAGEGRQALGIDLGTTKSCLAVARFEDGELTCECVPFSEPGQPEGEISVPSLVAVRNDGPVFGQTARRLIRSREVTRHRGYFAETKNEIGLRHTYARAPEGFRDATQIAGHLLGHLVDASDLQDEVEEPVVITVPASFHGAQRTATLEAADLGMPDVCEVQLLDEPYAVMLDLLHRQPEAARHHLAEDAHWLVFDFGGGTCDVALFALTANNAGVLAPRLLATSRYHRIGGGDIDRAIVHGHLIPLLLARYGINRSDVSFGDKRKLFEPLLLPVAEQLKLSLCRRLRAVRASGQKDVEVEAVATTDILIPWKGRELWVTDPRLDQETFERLLKPFVNPHPGVSTSDEFVERDSIFNPIVQVIARAGIPKDGIDVVLLAGSSSLIPQVREALQAFLPESDVLQCAEDGKLAGAVARGAALQALSLAVTGQPLIAPVCSADLALHTRQGLLPLARAGGPLPANCVHPITLLAPEDSPEIGIDLSIEVIADGQRMVGRSIWNLDAPVRKGEPLSLDWSLDENQCLTLRVTRQEGAEEDEGFEDCFDAPLTHVDQGHAARTRLLEWEELVRTGVIPGEALGEAFTQMARDAAVIRHHEKALHCIACAMQHLGTTRHLLQLRAMYLEALGDFERAEEAYRQVADGWAGGFNLALFLHHRKRHAEALEVIDQVPECNTVPADLVLKGDIVAALGNESASRLLYQDAVSRVTDPGAQSQWALGWLASGARKIGQADLAKRFTAIREERVLADDACEIEGAFLPDSAPESKPARQAA
jgi:hypothetical protein